MVKKILFSAVVSFLLLFEHEAKAQLYNNEPLSAGSVASSGFMAPSGYMWSELQNNTGNSAQANSTAGLPAYYYADGSSSYTLADDFTIPPGQTWQISSFDFFCYQPVYAGAVPPVNEMRIRLYSSDPSVNGALPIAGDLVANVYDAANSENAFMYRIFNAVVPTPQQPNFIRKIFRIRGNLDVTLLSGQYWVEFQAHATDNTEVFFPPVTIVGSRSLPGANSKVNVIASADALGWANNIDSGIPNSAPDVALALPFLINGFTLSNVENHYSSTIHLYSNDENETVSVHNPNGLLIEYIEIFDANARLIKRADYNVASDFEVAVSEFEDGIYFMRLTTSEEVILKRFFKS
jgi:hypothetical protein